MRIVQINAADTLVFGGSFLCSRVYATVQILLGKSNSKREFYHSLQVRQ